MNTALRLPRLLAVLVAAAGASAAAQSTQEQSWEFKDWRASATAGPPRARQCSASTGGDGDASLRVSAAAPGDFAVVYVEPTARGIRPAMKPDDLISFRLDDKQASVFDATLVNVGVDREGIPFANAGLVAGSATDMLAVMRSASSVTVLSRDKRSGKQSVVRKFQLAGFTANLLKLSEWCGFDANRLKNS